MNETFARDQAENNRLDCRVSPRAPDSRVSTVSPPIATRFLQQDLCRTRKSLCLRLVPTEPLPGAGFRLAERWGTNMTRQHMIMVEHAHGDLFAPYGELIHQPSGDPVFKGIQVSSWPTIFRCEDDVQLMLARFGWQEPCFTKMERHRGITQTFTPLAPRRFVMVVASPTADDEWPAIENIRAFMVPPGAAVIIGDSVWHALDRFLLEPEPMDFLMLTSAGVQAELEAQNRTGDPPKRTDMIDFADRDMHFRLAIAA